MKSFKGGKAVTSPGTKLQEGSGVRPKVGRNMASVGPRVGRAVMGKSNEVGGLTGRASLRPAGSRGLINRE
jgi:hypothetical protein